MQSLRHPEKMAASSESKHASDSKEDGEVKSVLDSLDSEEAINLEDFYKLHSLLGSAFAAFGAFLLREMIAILSLQRVVKAPCTLHKSRIQVHLLH